MMCQFTSVVVAVAIFAVAIKAECPRQCRCDKRKAVYCNEKRLHAIPYGIPEDTQTLFLQRNNVTNGPLTSEILSGLTSLKKLDLHKNKLTSVPKRLPNTLEHIDFRINCIKYVGRESLLGMRSLVELHLDENNITNQGLSPSAFQDTTMLEILILSNNLLTAFPENLPVSLRVLRLDNNLITTISRSSMARLTNLRLLELSNNAIQQTRISPGAMLSLTSLSVLDISRNQLSEIPRNLPSNVQELMLSHNKIEYIYASANAEHGSLQEVKSLTSLDLSSNQLRSVEGASFSHLNLISVELENNPWQCDCHLRYMKQWLSNTDSVFSSESNIRCSSPSAFSGVTLNNIDVEALNCVSKTNTREFMKIKDVTSGGFRVEWKSPTQTPDPPFIKRFLIYGPLKCSNCSIQGSPSQEQPLKGEAISFLETYSSKDISAEIQANPYNTSIEITSLSPGVRYAVCIFDSQQNDKSVSIEQCVDVQTNSIFETSTPHREYNLLLPMWVIVLSCVVLLLVVIVIVGLVVWKKRNTLKSKTPRMYTNRDDRYYPDAYLPGFTQPMRFRPTPQPGYDTYMTDRTYAECGPASTAHRTIRDSAIDARMEFDVLLKPENSTSPKVFHSPSSSYSECQDNNTMSTSQTGRCSAHDQTASPPPTYDSLHSYTPLDQRSSIANGTITNGMGHDSASYV